MVVMYVDHIKLTFHDINIQQQLPHLYGFTSNYIHGASMNFHKLLAVHNF